MLKIFTVSHKIVRQCQQQPLRRDNRFFRGGRSKKNIHKGEEKGYNLQENNL